MEAHRKFIRSIQGKRRLESGQLFNLKRNTFSDGIIRFLIEGIDVYYVRQVVSPRFPVPSRFSLPDNLT